MADETTPQPTGGAAGQAGTAAVPQPTGAKVEFSAEQRAEVNRLAAEARREEREANEKKRTREVTDLQAKLDRLNAERMTEDEKKVLEAEKAGYGKAAGEFEPKITKLQVDNAILLAGANPALGASILEQLRDESGSLGDISTLKDRIVGLYTAHPYFKAGGDGGPTPVPQSGAPAGRALSATIKRSDLKDHRVYLANEEKIRSGEVRVVEG